MKLHYYPETDSFYIELTSAPGAEAREIVEGLVVDFDANGNVVGLDIDHASRKLDLEAASVGGRFHKPRLRSAIAKTARATTPSVLMANGPSRAEEKNHELRR